MSTELIFMAKKKKTAKKSKSRKSKKHVCEFC